MQTDAFITAVTGNNTPGHTVTPGDELRAYAAALRIAASLAPRIAKHTASPTHASYFALMAEHAHRTAAYAQILAADLAQRTLVHELPVAQLNELRPLAKNPEDYISGARPLPDDPRTVPAGRPTFKNTIDFLQNVLHVSFFEARDRLQSGTNLLPRTDANGAALPPRFPKLAVELISGNASPGAISTAAKKLDALRPHINQQPDPHALSTELEEQVLESVRAQDPRTTRRLLSNIQSSLEQGIAQPSEEVLRSRLGLFYRGMNSGTVEFLLRTLPGDAEFILSLCAQTDNPRTKAGDREGLLQQSPFAASPRSDLAADVDADPSSAESIDRGPASTPVAATNTTFPDFLLAPSATHDKPLATAEELAAITLGNEPWQSLPQSATPTPDRFELLNQSAPGADGLTPPQRHLQGLLNLLKSNGRATNPKKSTGLPSPDMVIIATLAELEERASTSGITRHGQQLGPAELRQNLCNCRAIPIVMNGKSQILDLGRAERYFPDYMRQAILARDGGCVVPGCTVPPEHCEIHHLKAWELGGLTRVEDGTPACSGHHHAVHAGLIRIVHNDDGLPAAMLPKFMDPEQKPRRNTYWNPRPAFTAPALF